MIAGLKPYAEYKDSMLPWLQQVPGHWNMRRMKSAVANVIEQTFNMGPNDVYVALEHVESWTGRARPQRNADLFSGQVKRFRTGDVLFGKLRPYLAKVTRMNDGAGVCAGEFFVLRPIGSELLSSYLAHQLRAKPTIDVINGSTFGARMPRADWQFCGNLSIAVPPLDEQAAIARFLDWANGRLERAIRAKRKVIALLTEQKTVIVYRAVTRGLNPTVCLKASGFPWIDPIPQHWEVLALKRVLKRLIDCEHKTAPRVDQSPYRVVRTTAVRHGTLRSSGTYCTSYPAFCAWTRRGQPEAGDVIFTREAPAGEACIVPEGISVCLGQRTVLMKPNKQRLNSQLLVHLIYGGPPRVSITLATQGSTVGHFNMTDIGALMILLPPKPEQDAIVSAIEERTAGLDSTIARLASEIDLLREYRTRLVADVVTGKLDVREAAARLPDELGSCDRMDEVGGLIEEDDLAVEDLDALPEEAEE